MKKQNRRHFSRIRIDRSVRIALQIFPVMPFLGHPIDAGLVNLSPGGLALAIDPNEKSEGLKKGRLVKIHFRLPGMPLEECAGLIGHNYLTQQGERVVGIRFTKVSAGVIKELERMCVDNTACDRRVRENQNVWCMPTCGFYSLCRKPIRQEDGNIAMPDPLEISLQGID
jgi:c-di-GMP-binding flagellar brake protein YcgR